MPVVVVTDSSARLPADLRRQWGIREVPLHILFDGNDLRDGVDDIPDDIHDIGHATTAAATPAELAEVYRQALDESAGAGVVAVHLSKALSGTYGAAESTAAEIGSQIRVLDSKFTGMNTGFIALAAARAAAQGADQDAVVAAAQAATSRNHGFVVVHQLDNLRRSGRIGGAGAWLGTKLSLKPLLRIEDGKLVLAQRVRTASKAVATMIDRVVDTVGDRRAAVAVHHVANPEGAQAVVETLSERLPACEQAIVTDLGPVLALHVGAGALGVCVEVDD
ncbi:DegV family protein [Mycobacterium paraterrae]|uniref:DegV family protein n=1 Tax=Mycobacterium paraterrae TaxID=577492 RepID=A0ABY3VPC3_9MYCO|nr:DegV family protein [Mycobacterium paraterrae]UMB71282.1 DegV family protein [Mycobacterium paraterrae]